MNGKILAPIRLYNPESLLVNGYFLPEYLINQRAQTVYTTPWDKSIDRWYLGNVNSANGEASTMTLTDAGIVLTASSGTPYIQQRLARIDTSRDYTSAWCNADGRVTIEILTSAWMQGAMQTHGFIPINFIVPSGTTIRWAALCPGVYAASTIPHPVPRLYSVELAECRRWYHALDASKWYEVTKPRGDNVRFEVLGSFYRAPTLIGTPKAFLEDGNWHELTPVSTSFLSDRCIFRFNPPSNLVKDGAIYLLSGVSGVSCEL